MITQRHKAVEDCKSKHLTLHFDIGSVLCFLVHSLLRQNVPVLFVLVGSEMDSKKKFK